MEAFQPLFYFNLPIPVWQIVLYVGLMSIFLIAHKVRLSLITSYLFILFWLYYSFRGDLVSVTKQDFVVKNVYNLFGFVLVGLGVFAFFFLERGSQVLLENIKKRSGEIADLKSKLKKAEKRTRSLELEVEETQSGLHAQASGLKRVLDAKIGGLEDRLEDREALLEKRDGEIAAYKLKAEEAEKRAHALETQAEENQRSFQTEESALKKKLEQELNAKIGELEGRLKDRESHLEKSAAEIAAFNLKAEEAEKKAQALKTQVEEAQKTAQMLMTQAAETQRGFQNQESAIKKKLEQELNAKIGELGGWLKDRENLLEKRHREIEDLKLKAEEAEKKSRAWKTQVEETQQNFRTQEATLKKKLGEIEDLKLKGGEAEKKAQALETQIEEIQRSFQTRELALKKKQDDNIDELEHRLKEREGLLEKRAGEIANFKLKVEEAEKTAQDLKSQVAETQRSFNTRESALKNKLEEELNAKIDQLEHRLKEGESLIEKRAGEIENFKLKAEEAEKRSQALKMQAEETQRSFHTQESALKKNLEQNQNEKIGELEHRLKDRESLIEKRDSEVANFKLKAEEAEKKAQALKTQVEEAQKTAQTLMTQVAETQRSFHSQESALKKKLEEELNAKIGELENQLKDREGLLQKRDGEIAAFKLKAEEAEKSAQALKMQAEEIQRKADGLKNQEQKDLPGSKVQDYNHKNLEQELKNKLLELKDLQAQVNHKDGLLSLMAKRNKELADLKSTAEQKIEALEAQLKDGHPVLRTDDSGNGHSNPDQNLKARHT